MTEAVLTDGFEVEHVPNVLSSDGTEAVRTPPPLSDDELQWMLEEMIRARIASERLVSLQRQGRVGTLPPIDGQEAVTVAAVQAFDPQVDWIVPQYREMLGLRRFAPDLLERAVLQYRGHPSGKHIPAPSRVWPAQISIATQMPQAMGLAWGEKIRRSGAAVLVFCGDGTTSEGDFYEAGNFAGVLEVPLVIVCVNNGWAISTARDRQTAATTIAHKAAAFGMPGYQVDGNDPLAVFEVVSAAAERARTSSSPSFIEGITYRLSSHTTADDATRYVPPGELEHWQQRDPIVRFSAYLRAKGLWDDEIDADVRRSADEAMEAAVVAGESVEMTPGMMFDHLTAGTDQRLAGQRAAVVERLGGA